MDVYQVFVGEGPLVAAAIHNGHWVRPDVVTRIAVDESQRLREEDPFTDQLAAAAPTRLIGQRSRFEMDLNRPRDEAVYLRAEDAWGLDVWRGKLPPEIVAQSLANYDHFYATTRAVLQQQISRYGRVVVLDLHSYNHRRSGPLEPPADEAGHPEINVGAGSVDRQQWGPLLDRFVRDLRAADVRGRKLDVRENVKFLGGHFPRWINSTFPGAACAIAVEFKKTFMDEWTGELDRSHLLSLKSGLEATLPGLLAELNALGPARSSSACSTVGPHRAGNPADDEPAA